MGQAFPGCCAVSAWSWDFHCIQCISIEHLLCGSTVLVRWAVPCPHGPSTLSIGNSVDKVVKLME